MAFAALEDIRVDRLNPALGLPDDSAVTFGDTTARNAALSDAFGRLWPTMARLQREAVTISATATDYTLTEIVDAEVVEVLDADGTLCDRITDFRVWEDESSDSNVPVRRLQFPPSLKYQNTSQSLRVIGYSPYIIPTLDADLCDLPDRLLYVVVLGAQASIYKAEFNKFIASQQRGGDNPRTATSASEMFGMYQSLQGQFRDAMNDNRRSLVASKRTSLSRR